MNLLIPLKSFQVIEHIKNDKLFIKEIHRILKPGGKALISNPNISMTLTKKSLAC
ncbi:MAG: hypothetical protein Ct9H90mP3_4380 [Flammeovirgaceae bacterium]|nr:MAG: hypothetical protein Ct9H90mP3_4380 [Flammeovirgaceae bacterium]